MNAAPRIRAPQFHCGMRSGGWWGTRRRFTRRGGGSASEPPKGVVTMTSEAELQENRVRRGEALREHGASPFPSVSYYEREQQQRDELLLEVQDEAFVKALPHEADLSEADLQAPERQRPLFGRLVAKRGPFLVLRTPKGDAQALVRPDALNEAEAAALKLVDLADHVSVSGIPIQTRTGAMALRASRFSVLAKAHLPPPAKWHGLKDVEKRYRERYVDLFANPDVAHVFRARSVMTDALRDFLRNEGFLEVETPLLHSVRGGATAKPFRTHHNALDLPLYLRIAPELYLKRLIVGGLERVFEIGRTFRNEGISTRHNPEFTLLEFYSAYTSYEDLMKIGERLIRGADAAIEKSFPGLRAERSFTLEDAWPRVSLRQALIDCGQAAEAGKLKASRYREALKPEVIYDAEAFLKVYAAIRENEAAEANRKSTFSTYGEAIFDVFEEVAEPVLTKLYRTEDGTKSLPVFLHEYPAEVSPLARRNDKDPRFVDRFELFVDGKELANAFNELNDPEDQAARFRRQLEKQSEGDDEAMDFDEDYIRALAHGMPPTAGFGLGVDRLAMMLLGQDSIRDVLAFPLLRPALETTSEDAGTGSKAKETGK